MKSVYISGLTYIMRTGGGLSGPCTRRGGSPYANGALSRRPEGGKEKRGENEREREKGEREKRIKTHCIYAERSFGPDPNLHEIQPPSPPFSYRH